MSEKYNFRVRDSFMDGKAPELLRFKRVIRTRQDVAKLVTIFGGIGAEDIYRKDLIPENPAAERVLKIIHHSTRGKNPAMSGEFNDEYHGNPRGMLKAAQNYLSELYGVEVMMTGKLMNAVNSGLSSLITPYGIYELPHHNLEETDDDYGAVKIIKPGVKIGDTVRHLNEEGIVVAGRRNGGVDRLTIRLKDGACINVSPFYVSKIEAFNQNSGVTRLDERGNLKEILIQALTAQTRVDFWGKIFNHPMYNKLVGEERKEFVAWAEASWARKIRDNTIKNRRN